MTNGFRLFDGRMQPTLAELKVRGDRAVKEGLQASDQVCDAWQKLHRTMHRAFALHQADELERFQLWSELTSHRPDVDVP
jgi:hypothetical protein